MKNPRGVCGEKILVTFVARENESRTHPPLTSHVEPRTHAQSVLYFLARGTWVHPAQNGSKAARGGGAPVRVRVRVHDAGTIVAAGATVIAPR